MRSFVWLALALVLGAVGCSSSASDEDGSSENDSDGGRPRKKSSAPKVDEAEDETPDAGVAAEMDGGDQNEDEQDESKESDNAELALDECDLDTQWAGDEFCIEPPPSDKGFQFHIGPEDYDNPDEKYVMEPGEEVTEDWPSVSGNEDDVYYYWRQYRMRPGSHHLIVTTNRRRLGGTQNTAKDNPTAGEIAPENEGVGMLLPAQSPLNSSLHYINYTDKPIIKEAWVNFWYRDPSEVVQPASEVFSFAPIDIAPGEHVILAGTCPVMGSGHALNFYGHVHANNERFSVWRVRGDQRNLVYESYDWEHPAVAEYSSLVTNPAPDAATKTSGGWSGVLDLQQGDEMYFECQIINNTNKTFRGANEALDDEMCILVGDTVGASVPFMCSYETTAL